MKLLILSDWRSQPIELVFETLEHLDESVDLILYAGDDLGRFYDNEEQSNLFSELAEETCLGKVLAVAGNDDIPSSAGFSDEVGTELPSSNQVLRGEGVYDLHQNPIVEGDYVFLGLEGAVEGGPGLTLYSEEEIEKHLDRQYEGFEDKTPVLVSHVPPNGILDIGHRFGQRHIGSSSVRRFIEDVSPVLTVCGHCHQFGGRAEEGEYGTVINIASHDDSGAKGRYGIVELEGESVGYELSTTDSGVDSKLLKLSQVGGNRARQFEDAGFSEFDDIVEDRRGELLELPGVSDWHVNLWLEEVEAIQNGEVRVRDLESFEFLEQDDLVLLDIETDLQQAHIWLVGLYSYGDGEVTQVFEKDDEEKLLEQLVDYLRSRGRPTVVYYGNNRFDEECLKQRMQAHGLGGDVELLEGARDLGIQVQKQLLGSFSRTNLDTVSKILADYEYQHPDIDGFVVGSKFTKYKLDGKEPDWEKLLEYNQDDVMAVKEVVDQIRELI